MLIRELGLRCQELETGPLTFLLSYSVPVAYHDRSSPGMAYFRTSQFFNKATTAHLNKWLKDKPFATLPHEKIVEAFMAISRFTEPLPDRRTANGRREQDHASIRKFAESLLALTTD